MASAHIAHGQLRHVHPLHPVLLRAPVQPRLLELHLESHELDGRGSVVRRFRLRAVPILEARSVMFCAKLRTASRHHWLLCAVAAWAFFLFASSALAHEPSKSYLNLVLESNQFTGQWDIPLRDVQAVVPLELDPDGTV